jgi:hypothetical protein
MEDMAGIIEEFRTVYADAVTPCLTETVWKEAARKRTLEWRSECRIPLKDAAVCYAQIVDGYNEFRPHMIADLHAAFDDCGIEVTPAREYSVGIYLHVPDKPGLRKRVEGFVRANFQADLVSWQGSETLHVWWD